MTPINAGPPPIPMLLRFDESPPAEDFRVIRRDETIDERHNAPDRDYMTVIARGKLLHWSMSNIGTAQCMI
jgi:hypothetical protein